MSFDSLPAAELRHRIPGRTRVRVPSMRGRDDYFERVRAELSRCEYVEDVLVNPKTASVLVLQRPDSDAEAVGRFSQDRGLFRLVAPEAPPEVLSDHLAKLLDWRSADARKAMLTVFLAGGVYQFFRGNIWPAGMTLLWYALTMLPPGTNPERGPGTRGQ
ncbi:MAG TPA: hypothetical protein VIE88_07075, partial [Vicinamibacteria bacterium]